MYPQYSPIFQVVSYILVQALFASNMKERQNGKVELKYLNKSMCMTLLEFIYTGNVIFLSISITSGFATTHVVVFVRQPITN